MAWYNPFDWGKSNAAAGVDPKPVHFDAATAQLGQAAKDALRTRPPPKPSFLARARRGRMRSTYPHLWN